MRTQQDWTPAEHAIYNASQEVEKMPADVRLTNAVNYLSKARAEVEAFITDKGNSEKNVSTETA